ncbi:hypothetical protein LXL04_035208 [Taraxacum kok-saghyz]
MFSVQTLKNKQSSSCRLQMFGPPLLLQRLADVGRRLQMFCLRKNKQYHGNLLQRLEFHIYVSQFLFGTNACRKAWGCKREMFLNSNSIASVFIGSSLVKARVWLMDVCLNADVWLMAANYRGQVDNRKRLWMNGDHMLPGGLLQPFEGRGHLQWDPLGISYEQGRRGRTCTPFQTPLSQDPTVR